MQPGDIAFICVAVGAITLFGGVLAWASWMEWRGAKKKAERREIHTAKAGKIDIGSAVQRSF